MRTVPRLLVASFSVCPAPDRHGAQLVNVLKALSPRFEMDVMTLRVGELPYVDRFLKARMLRVPVGAGGLCEQAETFGRALRRQLEGEEYDIIHLRSGWGARALLAHAATTTRLIYEVARSLHGEPAPADEDARRVLADEEAACLERADLVLVPTEWGRLHLEARGLGNRAVVLPPGVDIDEFDWEPNLEERPDWLPRSRGGSTRILFAGRIAAGCGVRLLVRALGLLKQAYDVRLLLAGPVAPEFRAALDEAIHFAEVESVVDRLGPIQHADLPRVIAQSTICVAPAAPDLETRPLAGCSVKVLEYLACRRAVVAPRRPTILDVMRDGRDGLLFAPDDAHDLASTIARLIDDAPLRRSLAESGYARVRVLFPAAAARRALLAAYARVSSPSTWTPPAHAAEPIGAMPVRLDTTTSRILRGEPHNTDPPVADHDRLETRHVPIDALLENTPADFDSADLEVDDDRASTGRHVLPQPVRDDASSGAGASPRRDSLSEVTRRAAVPSDVTLPGVGPTLPAVADATAPASSGEIAGPALGGPTIPTMPVVRPDEDDPPV